VTSIQTSKPPFAQREAYKATIGFALCKWLLAKFVIV
jgi:hypothetical protein